MFYKLFLKQSKAITCHQEEPPARSTIKFPDLKSTSITEGRWSLQRPTMSTTTSVRPKTRSRSRRSRTKTLCASWRITTWRRSLSSKSRQSLLKLLLLAKFFSELKNEVKCNNKQWLYKTPVSIYFKFENRLSDSLWLKINIYSASLTTN